MLLQLPERGSTRLFARGHLFWEVKVGVPAILSAGADFPGAVWDPGWFGYLPTLL